MKLIPKRKLALQEEDSSSISNAFDYITKVYQGAGEFDGTLDDIMDGIVYGRVLQTNLSSGNLNIITAQSSLLDMVPATTNTSDLGSSSKEWALGYIKYIYADTRLQIPVGANMYD